MSLFKPFGQEFFQHEIDALAAEFGKLAHEIDWIAEEATVDGVLGRWLKPKHETAPVAPAPAPVVEEPHVEPTPEPEATAPQEAAPVEAENKPAA